jgi:hypothetical protein
VRRAAALIAILGFAALAPARAAAYPGQWSLGPELDYGHIVFASPLPSDGVGAGVQLGWGLWDVWELRGRLAYVFHPAAEPLHVGIAQAEMVYLVDVLEWVPFIGAGLDGLGTLLQGLAGTDFAIHLTAGVDWLATRGITLGLDLRAYLLLTELFATGNTDPVYLTASLRCSFVFEQ